MPVAVGLMAATLITSVVSAAYLSGRSNSEHTISMADPVARTAVPGRGARAWE